jgi:hypothetical protein
MKRIEHIYIISCLTFIIVSVALFSYWAFYPQVVIRLTAPITLDKSSYSPGDRLSYTYSYCKDRQLPGIVVRALVNGTRTTFTTITSDLTVGCHTSTSSDLVIPDYADSGTYHLEGTAEYRINPINTYMLSWKSQEFKITRSDCYNLANCIKVKAK